MTSRLISLKKCIFMGNQKPKSYHKFYRVIMLLYPYYLYIDLGIKLSKKWALTYSFLIIITKEKTHPSFLLAKLLKR